MDQQTGGANSKTTWIIAIIIILVLAGLAIWYFTKAKPSSTTTTSSKSTVYTPKHTDWTVYKSTKFGYNLSHPADYVLAETGDKSINLTKGDKIMVELYFSSSTSDGAVAMYTEDAKGYMTGGKAESVTIAGTTGQKVSGTFGKFGGNRMVFEGIKGSTTIFEQGQYTFFLNSYDNADAAALEIYNDIAADLQF